MENNLKFYRKLPIPKEIKEQMPLKEEFKRIRSERLEEMRAIFEGRSSKLLLIIGPCSADNEISVLDYFSRLRILQDKVNEKIMIVPRLYTNKPRTTGQGYKGMLHQPDPNAAPDLLKGMVAIRHLHIKAIEETGFTCADEMLYPENYRYLSDLLGYVSVGARSSEDQQHRLTASGIDIPVGMKNPTGGNLGVMINSIKTAQSGHTFLYRGWEVESSGNPLCHGILRGYVDNDGVNHQNYSYDCLSDIYQRYMAGGIKNPSLIVDVNHCNSGKDCFKQPSIAKDVISSCKKSTEIRSIVKGLMIESYIEDGAQEISDHEVYGRSITDPCLGFDKTQRLIFEIADLI